MHGGNTQTKNGQSKAHSLTGPQVRVLQNRYSHWLIATGISYKRPFPSTSDQSGELWPDFYGSCRVNTRIFM